MAARFAEHPEAVAETLRLAERLEFDLTTELGYRHPRQGDVGADLDLAALCRQRLVDALRRTCAAAEAEARLDQELATIRHLNLSGFFLLHHELLELAREVAGRGARPRLGPRGPAAGPRPRLQRQLDRLLPDRPLPHRPGQGEPLRRPLPQRRSGVDPRHRPRLPPRHPRGPDPRASTRSTAPTARPSSPPSRPTGRAASCATSARCWGCRREEIEKVARTVGFHESQGGDRARRRSPRSAPSAPPRRAGRRCSGSPATRSACPATPPSTPAGW